jgi:hypothetical protein
MFIYIHFNFGHGNKKKESRIAFSTGGSMSVYVGYVLKEFKMLILDSSNVSCPTSVFHLEISDMVHHRCIQDNNCSMIFPPTRGNGGSSIHIYMLVVNPKPKGQHSHTALRCPSRMSNHMVMKNKFGTTCYIDKFMATTTVSSSMKTLVPK